MTGRFFTHFQTISSHFLAVEWLLLALCSPLFLFPSPARSFILLLIPLLWLARYTATGHFVAPTPLTGTLLLLLVMVGISLYATPDVVFSFPKVAGVLFGVALFYAVITAVSYTPHRLWVGIAILWAGGTGVALISLVGTNWSEKVQGLGWLTARLPGPFITLPGAEDGFHPNQVAGTLLWVLPVALAGTVVLLRNWRTIVYGRFLLLFALLITPLMLFVLLLTQSRSAWLGFGVGCLFMGSLSLQRYGRFQLIVLFIAILWVVGGVIYVGPETAVFWLQQQIDTLFNLTGGDELTGRIEIWSRALWGVQDFSFTGMGMNNFRRIGPQLYPYATIQVGSEVPHAHNNWLQIALDLGVPGLIVYLAFWFGLLGLLWQVWRISPDWRPLTIGFAASLLSYEVYGLTDTVALGAKPGVLFWLLAGLITSTYLLVNQSPTSNPQSLPPSLPARNST